MKTNIKLVTYHNKKLEEMTREELIKSLREIFSDYETRIDNLKRMPTKKAMISYLADM